MTTSESHQPVTPEQLVSEALLARECAYAPYSEYQVGAAVLTVTGEVVHGCNVENASYPATICAERVALTAALAAGHRSYTAIAVATQDGGSPCGICRQVMAELGPDMVVYLASEDGRYRSTSVRELLPDAFTYTSLHQGH